MTGTDHKTSLGVVRDWLGRAGDVSRNHDRLDLTYVDELSPAGVRELEKAIGAYWNDLARLRLRNLDLGVAGIDVGYLRDGLAALGFGYHGEPDDLRYLAGIDWQTVGRQLEGQRPGTYSSVRKLHALLTADAIPIPEDGPLCSGCGDPAGENPTPIENDGVICADCADEAGAAGSFPFEPEAAS
jgi:hypothetical protein